MFGRMMPDALEKLKDEAPAARSATGAASIEGAPRPG
jgi:hypothetical protein